jgi:hypothetical protein
MLMEILISSATSGFIAWYIATRRSPTIRARDFAVVDEMGRVRASLGMGPTGPQLEIGGQSGRFRILLGMDKGIPKLIVGDEQGNDRLILANDVAGPSLHIVGSEQHTLLSLQDNLADGGTLTFYSPNGKPKLMIGNVGQQPVVLMYDDNGETTWHASPHVKCDASTKTKARHLRKP